MARNTAKEGSAVQDLIPEAVDMNRDEDGVEWSLRHVYRIVVKALIP